METVNITEKEVFDNMLSMYYEDGFWVRFKYDNKIMETTMPKNIIDTYIDNMIIVDNKPYIKFKSGTVIQIDYESEFSKNLLSDVDFRRIKSALRPFDFLSENQKTKHCLIIANKVMYEFDTVEEAHAMIREAPIDFIHYCPGTKPKTETETEIGIGTEIETGIETGIGTEIETRIETGIGTEIETETPIL